MKYFLRLFCSLLLVAAIVLGFTARHYREKSKNQFQVKVPVNATLFLEKLTKEPPDWMLAQIRSDLSAYEKISKEELDQFFQGERIEKLKLIRFTIKDRQISVSLAEKNLQHKQFIHLLAAFKKINELVILPDVDFIISLEDGFYEDLGVPLFVYAKSQAARSLVLIPDFKALTGYSTLRKEIEKGNQKWSWESKKVKAFWRGSTTGGWLTTQNWDKLARVKLALLASAYPEKLDACITGVVQCDPEIPELIKSKGLLSKRTTQANHLKYKYLVDVDGNSCSFERYFWVLLSNSVVLKQITPNIQWYYGGLKPYQHFVPVKEDLSDLLEKIEWAQTHDAEAKQIAANATQFVKNSLSQEDIFLYTTHLLREYAKRQM